MHVFRTKKRLAIGAGIAVLSLGIGTAAYAYFTNSGTGTGTATVGTSGAITISGSAAGLAYPGAAGQTVTFTAANPNSGNQQVRVITLTDVRACATGFNWDGANCYDGTNHTNDISSLGGVCETMSAAASNPGGVTWYMAPITANEDITHGAVAQALTHTGTLVMNDLAANQDLCKDANIAMTFATS